MKVAKLIIRVVELACPECGAVYTKGKAQSSIHRDQADMWDGMMAQPLTCSSCHKQFKLPRNPFQSSK